MTCEAGNTGEGTAPAVPDPGSVTDAAIRALAEFGKAERIVGSVIAHATFDGILAEHAASLEEIRDMLGEAYLAVTGAGRPAVRHAQGRIDDEITYIRALGSVSKPATTEEDETDA